MAGRTKAIGIFDSGLGGLTVFKDIQKQLPGYRYIYLGDTARAPYGDRSKAQVLKFAKQAVDFLFAHDCELIIFACNTASAEALRTIQRSYLPKKYGKRKRILGVIVPALEEVASSPGLTRLGVIATEGTVASGAYPRELKKMAPRVRVFQSAAPLLAPAVEAGEANSLLTKKLIKGYLAPLLKKNIDALLLGCTHYGHLEKQIRAIVGRKVRVILQGPLVARKLHEYLIRHPEMETMLERRPETVFYTTDRGSGFARLSALFFGKAVVAKRALLEYKK
jgi:glutamate racemase